MPQPAIPQHDADITPVTIRYVTLLIGESDADDMVMRARMRCRLPPRVL